MTRAFNFCAGPATIAESVLKRAQAELLDWRNSGMSVMEISHRSPEFLENVLEPFKANLIRLLNIPDHYDILLISTGASHHFSMVPLNLLNLKPSRIADYFYTGIWSAKAIKEARRYGDIRIAASSESNQFTTIPPESDWHLNSDASYVHYTPNETINGILFPDIPNTYNVPLVADMSSIILSRPLDISRFGLIYAGAQKNIGPAGLTLLIVRKDLLGKADHMTPYLYNYENYAKENSLCNTPATFSIYLAGKVLEWLIEMGGLEVMAALNAKKASLLYGLIDAHAGFYRNPIHPAFRSPMNVIFYLPNADLDQLFVQKASEAGLKNLKGHKLIGGVRASLYNALPLEGVETLVSFMKDFMRRYG